jgi:hypothetical protein
MSEVLSQIVGGIIATLSAVAAVVLTDWLRDRRKACHVIPTRLRADRAYASARAAEIAKALSPDDHGSFTMSKAQRFDVESCRRLVSDAFSHLTAEQRKKLAGIIFTMEEADEANAEAMRIISAAGLSVAAMPAVQAPSRREKFMLERTRDLIDGYLGDTVVGSEPRKLQV